MRKSLTVVVLLFVLYGICVSEEYKMDKRVVYELNESYHSLSYGEETDINYNDDIIVQIELSLDEEFEEEFEDYTITRNKNKRNKVKEFFNNKNNIIFKSLNISGYKNYYISKYTPYIELLYERDQFYFNEDLLINNLLSNEIVKQIYVKENYKPTNEQFTVELCMMDAYTTWRDSTYTGDGIKVGILETGIINVEDENLVGCTCYTFDEGAYLELPSPHATYMASYIGGNYGIAPDVEFYSAQYNGTPHAEVDWMMDNNVDIINMSYGETTPTGVYNSDSALMDFLVKTYGVIIVAAAGNSGETTGYICNPGLGYNVITVGSAGETLCTYNFSSYVVTEGGIKPTIAAPGNCVREADQTESHSGTSVSAALTTGVLSLLLEQYPVLQGSPERVMALVTSSAKHNDYAYAYRYDNGFYPAVGAGMINYENFCAHKSHLYTIMNINGRSGVCIYTKNLSLEAGDILKASIAWTVYATGEVSATKFTNYNLKITDSNGNVVAEAVSTNSNIELVIYEVETTGTYTLRIYQEGAIKKINEMIAISYGSALTTDNE